MDLPGLSIPRRFLSFALFLGTIATAVATTLSLSAPAAPSLARDEILAVIDRATDRLFGPSGPVEETFEIKIEPSGCDYLVIGRRKDPLAASDLLLLVDRRGKIVSFPHCLFLEELGDCGRYGVDDGDEESDGPRVNSRF